MNAAIQGPENAPASRRLPSLDAYRGWVMLLMKAEVVQFWRVAQACPGSGFWHFLARQQTHSEGIRTFRPGVCAAVSGGIDPACFVAIAAWDVSAKIVFANLSLWRCVYFQSRIP